MKAFLLYPTAHLPYDLPWLDRSYYLWRKVMELLAGEFSLSPSHLHSLPSGHYHNTFFWNALNKCSHPSNRHQVSDPYKSTGKIIGAPIILGRCTSLSAHESESMLRTYLVCREKQANSTWEKQYTNSRDPIASTSELLLVSLSMIDRLCGLVVRVLGYRFGGPGSIPGSTRFSGKKKRKTISGSGTGSTQPREYNWGATW
jgi:hypothetical protein